MLVKRNLGHSILDWVFKNPSRMIIFSFLLVILIGSVLLVLPFSTYSGHHLNYFEALFTAVSAVCVTGLIVADTATTFTIFGKVVLILLIQVGGLGLVTITSFIFSFTRKKQEFKTRQIAQETSGSFSFKEAPLLLRFILGLTLGFEFVGGCLFAIEYVPKYGWAEGLGKAFFQGISAYCNAGFDLMGNTESGQYSSLVGFYNSPLIVITTVCLILFGGLGFTVWVDLFSKIKNPRKHRLKIHSRIVLEWTLGLTLLGVIAMFILEFSNKGTMADMSIKDRLLSSLFQSVTFRTAGFNTIDLGALTNPSKTIGILLMFIGAGSGSTGGGIKITTFAIIVYSVISEIRGNKDTVTHKHTLPAPLVRRAVAIFFIGISVDLGLSILLSITEHNAIMNGNFNFIDVVFEVTSAFATVGVSSLGTPQLLTISKVLLIPAMFLGRVGPISLALSLAMRDSRKIGEVYPEGKVHIG
ncbi:MAG: Trk family potassium uptake protein [Clostridiales bacterium]|nr:Trk family potassium uptake protein [Clostridiales bacterium]